LCKLLDFSLLKRNVKGGLSGINGLWYGKRHM